MKVSQSIQDFVEDIVFRT